MASLKNRCSSFWNCRPLVLLVAAIGIAGTLWVARTKRFFGVLMAAQEAQISDWIHRTGRLAPEAPDIVVLGVDDATRALDSAFPEDIEASPVLQAMQKGWPYSREVWAATIERLIGAGARTVVLDFALPLPTPDHPERDAALRAALDAHRDQVALVADFEQWLSPGRGMKESFLPPWEGLVPDSRPRDARIGFATFYPDDDQVIRRVLTSHGVTAEPEDQVPLLAVAVLRQQKLPAPEGVQFVPIRCASAEAYRPLSLHEIFVPPMWESNYGSGGFFKGKTVLVGATARSFQDDVRTPVGTIFGVQLHAHVLCALRDGHLLRDAQPGTIAALLVVAVLLMWSLVVWVRRPLLLITVLLGGVALAVWGQRAAFDSASLLLPLLTPAIGWAAMGFVGLGYDFMLERRETLRLRGFLARYTSPELVEELMRDRQGLATTLGGVERSVTILFSDVRGFTSMSEGMTANEVVTQLNEYLSGMVEQVISARGVVDKFIGDAVMAAWGSLRAVSDEHHYSIDSRDAINSALAMRKTLDDLNRDWLSRGMQALHIGIGIHQGPVVVGNIGSGQPHEKMDFTVIGDAVNLASRLEGITKAYGVDIIVSDAVRQRVVSDFLWRTADLVKVKGKELPVEVFCVLDVASMSPPAGLEDYELAVAAYRIGNFEEAIGLLHKAVSAGLDDVLTREYLRRCESLAADPPQAWDGVYTMTSK
ncbi:MAG: adenylate/guanylate cyclase domain-containing protein [Verrucomicrobiaceae bacterium]|nr:adenylate/guanylate cyclase domain-containing protein [Verrucomicrobiaceae bacterium]